MIDFSLNPQFSEVEVNDEVSIIWQQIDMLFDTLLDEVLGENYGSDFHQFLWDMEIGDSEITDYTKNLIESNVTLFGRNVDVETKFLEGTQNDIILITIKIYNQYSSTEKTYKVE